MNRQTVKKGIRQALFSNEEPMDIQAIVEHIQEQGIVENATEGAVKKEVVQIIKDCLLDEELHKENGLIYTINCSDDESDTVAEEEEEGDNSNEADDVNLENSSENNVESAMECNAASSD